MTATQTTTKTSKAITHAETGDAWHVTLEGHHVTIWRTQPGEEPVAVETLTVAEFDSKKPQSLQNAYPRWYAWIGRQIWCDLGDELLKLQGLRGHVSDTSFGPDYL